MRKLTRILSIALITAGLVVLVDAGLTLVWKEPVSAAYGSLQQARANDQLAELEEEFPAPQDLDAARRADSSAASIEILADRFAQRISDGDAIGRLRISRIDLDAVLLEGTQAGTLQRGPGHYEDTPLPGQPGTVGIAGHRTTYGAPFRRIDEIQRGDEIEVELPYASFTYRVQKSEIVEPTEVQIVDPVGYPRLVLTACHPLYSAAQRYAVFARLVRTDR